MSAHPPRLAEWLMRVSLSRGDRDAVLGDLYEEFADRRLRDGSGRARRWYRRQVARSVAYTVGDGLSWLRMRGTMHDFRYALRSLRSTPTFTVVALVVLTLGIGATTAIFTVVDGVALRGLPYWRSDRLVAIGEQSMSHPDRGSAVPAADFEDWRREQQSFESLAAVQYGGSGFVMHGGGSRDLRALMVSAALFPMLHAAPVLGRSFTAADEVRGQARVAILSDAAWRGRFGADPGIVGRTLALENGEWTIVGVMPPSFMYPAALVRPYDLWVPYVPNPAELQRGDGHHVSSSASVVGRLKDGVSIQQARVDLERITGAIKRQNPVWMRDRWVALAPLQDAVVGKVKSWMVMLLAAVGFVLLIACVNVANLQLARATARSRDAAVRAALGASRWRILRGLLTESLLLSIAGTAVGLGLATWSVHLLLVALPPTLPRIGEVSISYRVLIAAAGLALAVAIGVTPVWQWSGRALLDSLRDTGRGNTAEPTHQRMRSMLLVAEVALAVVLLVGSGLFIASFIRLVRVDLGFDPSHVLSVDMSPRGDRDALLKGFPPQTVADIDAVFDRVRRIPGVEHAALVAGSPPLVTGIDRSTVTVPGLPAPQGRDDDQSADEKSVTADYFRVLGVPLVAGRFFTDADATAGAPPVVLLNDVAARRYLGTENPIGRTVCVGCAGDLFTVVGVVRATRLLGPEGELRPEVYRPFDAARRLWSPKVTLLLRTSGEPTSVAATVRDAIATAAPHLVAPTPQSYDDLFDRLVAQRKFNMIILTLFGVLAIAIAAAGIYGVMAYIVEQRTREIGLRIALGAEPSRVLWMVVGRAMLCMTAGLVVGLGAGWMLSRFVQAFLFEADAHDPIVYAGAAAVLILTGLVAAFVPARRASRVDPVVALRAQ